MMLSEMVALTRTEVCTVPELTTTDTLPSKPVVPDGFPEIGGEFGNLVNKRFGNLFVHVVPGTSSQLPGRGIDPDRLSI